MSDFSAPNNWDWVALQSESDDFLLSLYDWFSAEDWLSKAARVDFVNKIHGCDNPFPCTEDEGVWAKNVAAYCKVANRLIALLHPFPCTSSAPVMLTQGSSPLPTKGGGKGLSKRQRLLLKSYMATDDKKDAKRELSRVIRKYEKACRKADTIRASLRSR